MRDAGVLLRQGIFSQQYPQCRKERRKALGFSWVKVDTRRFSQEVEGGGAMAIFTRGMEQGPLPRAMTCLMPKSPKTSLKSAHSKAWLSSASGAVITDADLSPSQIRPTMSIFPHTEGWVAARAGILLEDGTKDGKKSRSRMMHSVANISAEPETMCSIKSSRTMQ